MHFANKNEILVFMCFLHIRQTCASDFFIAKQDDNDNYVCVTNSSFPMSWVQDDITTRLSYKPFYIPFTNDYKFDSSISFRDLTILPFIRNSWIYVPSSVDSEVNGIILDRRWEELKTYMTEFVTGQGTRLKYTTVLRNLRDDFEIPFSVRLKREGHVFLCDGRYPPNSNCYWLLLQAWSGTKTAIRKCNSGYIPSRQKKWAKAPCSDILKEQDHTNKPDSGYFSNRKWSHLKITKKGNVLSLISVNNKKEEKNIITLEDPEPIIGITHMIIHSKQFNGSWKIHNMEFIYTTEESTKIHLGNPINPQKNYLCINLFIAMCSSCTMTLTLEDSRNETIEEKVYKFSGPGWSEIKFTTENIKENNNSVKFLVSTSGSSYDRFWAIDDIRICQREEFRVIALTENATCQLMSDEDDVISLSRNVQALDSNCPEDSIGDFCVPCSWIFDSCERVEVCQKNKCVCSAGYKLKKAHTGHFTCSSACNSSFYGHGCLKQCLNCPDSECYHGNGTCKYGGECLLGYTGPKCDIRSALFFKKPPEIVEADYHEAVVIIKDFTIEKESDEEPDHYFVQYTHTSFEGNISEWTTVGSEIKFNHSTKITIRDLQPGTTYSVRAVIVSDNKVSYAKSYVEYSSFETLCDELTKDDITAQPSNTSVVILKRNSEKLCDFSHYVVQGASGRTVKTNDEFYLEGLKEFTHYTLTFKGRSKIQIEFQTTEGIPDSIWDLKFLEISATTVEIQWLKPNETKGNFKHYIVEYGVVSYLACRERLTVPMKARLKLLENVARVNELTPYATYSFSVSVANGVFESAPVTKEISTEASDVIGSEEIPIIENLAPKSSLLEVQLNTNCEKVRGPLIVKASAACSDKWCDTTRNPKTLNILTSNSLHLDNLSPFSNYTLHLQFCRNETYCSKSIQSQNFKTQPAAPNPVDNLLVYSKNENSVSLRWTPPYPPNGVLKKYFIQLSTTSAIEGTKNIGINQCALWSSFHCATIGGLETNQRYVFQILALNREPEKNGEQNHIRATTIKEAPEPPYNLKVDWTTQNNLELKWTHPNVSNGEIEFFNIHLDCGGRQVEKKLEIVDNIYKLIYNYTIESTEIEPSKKCDIDVSSNNGIESSPAHVNDTSPPTIPTLEAHLENNGVSNESVEVTILVNQLEKNSYAYLMLLVSEENQLSSNVETTLVNSRLVFNCSLNKSKNAFHLTIGDDNQATDCQQMKNPPLEENTEYNISIIVVNTFADKTRNATVSLTCTTTDGKKHINTTGNNRNMNYLFTLFALLLVLPAVLYYIRCRKQKCVCHKSSNTGSIDVLRQASLNIEMQQLGSLKEHDYQNCTLQSSKVPKEEFYDYVRTTESCGQLKRQHEIILETLNTYELLGKDFHLEYVDMNYTSGHQLEKVYIATQLPKKRQINRFWKILWDENVHHIVLFDDILSNGHKLPFEQYWPNQNENMRLGSILIECKASEKYEFYSCRTFTVSSKGRKRHIKQLHFSSDATGYTTTMKYVDFFQKIFNIQLDANSPILIHSSCGMSGNCFVLLCDISLRLATEDGVVDVMDNLKKLTESSSQLIVDYDHYLLAHRNITEGLLHTKTRIYYDSLDTTDFITPQLEEKFLEYLQETFWLDCYSGNSQKHMNIYCSVISSNDDNSKLGEIRKISVEGFNIREKFLVISHPSMDTIDNFWKQIEDDNISVIISVNGNVSAWLHVDISSMQLSSGTILKNKSIKKFRTYEWTTVEMNNRNIEIFSMKNWPEKLIQPHNVSDFVNFCMETNEILNKHQVIAVTCHDCLTPAGLYITMSYNIQKMKTEGVSDICGCIRLIRSQCQHFFSSKRQHKFLMDANQKYMDEFKLYEVR